MTTTVRERSVRRDRDPAVLALVLPIAVAALGAYALAANNAFLAQNVALLWAGAAMIFLGGRLGGRGRRGAPIAVVVFVLGFLQLFAIVWGFPFLSSLIALAGFACLALAGRLGADPADATPAVATVPLGLSLLAIVAVSLRAGGYV